MNTPLPKRNMLVLFVLEQEHIFQINNAKTSACFARFLKLSNLKGALNLSKKKMHLMFKELRFLVRYRPQFFS